MSENNITEDIILEKDAFEADQPEPTKVETVKPDRPDLVEIGDALDAITVDQQLVHIANTNQLDITWEKLQRLLDSLINQQCIAMEDKFEDEATKKVVENLSTKIIHSINDHSNCPFTIQRLCELVIEPKKYYKMYIKYLRAVEKVLSVTSYWEDYANKNTTDGGLQPEEPLLLPSFSVQLVPHNFETSVDKQEELVSDVVKDVKTEGESMEDVTKDEQVVEQVTKEEDVKEVVMEDVVKEETVQQEVTSKPEDEIVMEDKSAEEETSQESGAKKEEDSTTTEVKMDVD